MRQREDPIPKWAVRIFWWVNDWIPSLLTTAGTIGLAVVGLRHDETPWFLTLLLAALAVAGTAWSRYSDMRERRSHREKMLTQEHYERLYGSVESAVGGILDHLVQSPIPCDAECRASLYCFDERSKEFIMLARCSADAKHQEPGRRRYPASIGYISLAWNEQQRVSYRRWPKDPEEWIERASDNGASGEKHRKGLLPRDVAANISFKARSAVYQRIDYNGRRIGILVIESLKPNAVTNKNVEPVFESELWSVLGQIVFLAQDDFIKQHESGLS